MGTGITATTASPVEDRGDSAYNDGDGRVDGDDAGCACGVATLFASP